MADNTWTVQLEEDEKTGELILPIPVDLLNQMGWAEGPELWWDITPDGEIIIKEHTKED